MSSVVEWWQKFFGDDNHLQWSSLSEHRDSWSDHVLPWIKLIESGDHEIPIVLPRLSEGGELYWYGAGRSPRGALRLREALQAFIGPSYSDFDGRAYSLNLDDPVEAAFAEGTVSPVFRFRASKSSDVAKIQRALDLLCNYFSRIPDLEERTQRPLGILRAELDRAVVTGDESGARSLLERIRRIGRLDAENLLFLEVGVRAGFGQWRDLAEDTELLSQLIGLRLPKRVLADLHEALYRHYIEPMEDATKPALALAAFKDADLARYAMLFGTRRGIRRPPVLKAFFLYELARVDADQSLLTELADELEKLNDSFADALVGLRPASEPQLQPVEGVELAADKAFDDLEVDRALELYLRVPPSRKRISRLIRCAEDVGTAEAARRVIDGIAPEDEVVSLPASWGVRLQGLEQLCSGDSGEQTPRGWLDWARLVLAGMEEEEAITALRMNNDDWDPLESMSHDQVVELAGIFNSASGSADSVLREAVPLLFQTLVPESGEPPRHTKPLLQILVTKVALLGNPSQNELQLARELAAALLVLGLDQREYADLISDLEDLMGAQMSVFTFGWALDLVELFAVHACPEPERRLRLVLRVVDEAQRFSHRLSPPELVVVKQLCEDYDIDYPVEITQNEPGEDLGLEEALSGKKIAIYTLTESAGQRAAAFLQAMCPTVRVELNADHECTKRLINLARTADLFVFAWKSSKHQAYYCVKDNRDQDKPLIQPEGKGTSSILRAVLENA